MAGRPSVVADTPRKVSTNPTSEIGRLENEVHKWTREASFAIRALQNQPAATATPTAVTTPVTSSAAPIPALPPQPAAPLDGDLVAIAALTGKGFLHRNGEGDWSLDAEVLTEDSIPDLASSFVTTALASGEILVGNNSGLAEAVEMTGDVTISATGVTAIGAHKVTLGDMARGANAGWALLDGGADADLSFGKPAILGTVTEGIWHGTSVSEIYGGTNQTTYVLGDVLYASAANTLSRLAGNTTAIRKFLMQLGTGGGSPVSAAPVWDTITAADAGAEPALGNPGTSGWVLSSTTGGVRSWVAQSGGTSGANPTASHATNAAINGSAATFMRSDAVPAISTTAVWQLARVGLGAAAHATIPLIISDGNVPASSLLSTDYEAISAQSTSPGFNIVAASASAAHRGVFKAVRARGTLAAPTASASGDSIFSLLGCGFDGTAVVASAELLMVGDGTVAASTVPQAISFLTGSSGSRTETARFTSNKNLLIGGTSETGLTGGGGLKLNSSTDASTTATGSLITAGGLGVAKKAYIGTGLNLGSLTASTLVTADASKNFVSLANATGLLHNNGSGTLTYGTVALGDMARGANAGWALLDGGADADLSFGKPAILGTVTEGIWHGTSVSEIYGGTNQTTYVLGDVLYASAANTLSRLAGNTTATRKFLRQLGTGGGSPVSAAPVWDTITAADAGAEPALGNPGTSGWVLSSTTGGVRSWVAQSGGASGANPTASHATNAAINGSAATFMRSDAVPAISTTAVWQLARVGLGAAADATAILTVSGGVIRNIGSGGSYPATGVGAEMFYSTSAYFIGYNRGTTAYIPVVLSGSTITLSQGPTTISDATDSSSSITGGTIISGGAGIAKKLYVGTDIHAVGVLYGDSTTDSSSSITGGTILAGGLGVAKKAYIGTDLHALGLIYAGSGPTTLTNAAGNLLLAAHEKIANNTVLGNISGGAAVPSALTGAEVRTICGATTVGSNLFTLTNPSAITFIRINADNTVTALSDSSFRTAIGAGTSSFSGAYADLSGKPTLGTAAAHDVGYFDLAGSVTRASLGLATTDTPTFAGATINGSINQTVAANNYNTIGQDSTHNFSIGWTYNATPSSGFGLIAAYGKANDLYFQAKNIYFDSGSLAFAIQLLMSGRVRVGGGSDDGVNAFQVNGTIATTGLTVTNIISGNINGNAATVTNGITTGNYNSYSPTLTGGGASGTWSINVSGSAGSVAAGNITGTTLAGGVTGSSLTSVGTLTGLTCNGDIVISKYPGNLCIGGAGYGDWGVIRAQTGYLILNSGAWATVRINGLGSGTVESDSSGNLSTSSDERLKNILGPYTTGLAALRKLTPKSYRWNAASGLNPDDFNASLTAQDLIAAGISEAVTTYRTVPVMETVPQLDANGKPVLDGHGNAKTIRQAKADAEGHDIMEKVPANYSVSNRTILAVLVNAIKELANQVDALKKT